GGYVKMLGQDDNPGKLPEEMERAKLEQEHPGAVQPPLDPRSYIAQSVPKRMAIISAGVIMNLIFAVIFATIAYAMGVKFPPAEIGTVFAGEAGWKHGLRSGDKILKVNNTENPTFRDLQIETALARGKEVKLEVERRDGTKENL